MNSAENVLVLGASDWVGTLVVGGAVAVGTGVGLLLLFASSVDRRAASLLGAFLLAGASTVLGQLIANLELAYRYRVFEFIPLLHSFALGPLAYLYVRARVAPEQSFSRTVWLHATLPAAHFLIQVWVWTSPDARRAWFYERVYGPFGSTLEDVLFAATLLAYIGASWVYLRRRAGMASIRVAPGLRVLIGFLALALVSSTLFNVGLLFPGPRAAEWIGVAEVITYSALVIWLASVVLLGWLGRTAVSAEIPRSRTERYGIEPDELARHTAEVVDLIERERMYLDPELTLTRLAEELELPEKVLSFVLNEGVGSSYHDYINGLRVAEAKAQLADPGLAHRSVLAIATDAGFRSKATFNRVFKQVTGRTPSAYREDAESTGLGTS